MDHEFSEKIRAEVLATGEYYGPLYTESEVDAILDYDECLNADLPTKMVEAAIYRQAGILVDLDVQGAAALNVVKASTNSAERQQHNVISVEKAHRVQRTYDRRDEDSGLVPMLTPEDPNIAVRSIDFASGKATAGKLDLITMDANENPVELALIDQLVVCQALHTMGANVDSLIHHVSVTWGMAYVDKLVANLALAPIADIQGYLAVGGRPSPQLYISANYASSYRIVDRPTADLVGVGYSSAFFARSAAICKMLCATVEMIHGEPMGALVSFNTNPAQFNTFGIDELNGITLISDVIPVENPLCKAVANVESYEIFLKSRQAVKHVDAVGRSMAARDLREIEKISVVPRTRRFSAAVKKIALFDPLDTDCSKRMVEAEKAAPSKVTTMLFGFMHGDRVAADYLRSYEAILCSMVVTAGARDASDVARAYSAMVSLNGTSHLLRCLNVARCREALKELDSLLSATNDARRMTALYLLSRHRSLALGAHRNAHVACLDWIRTGKSATALVDKGPYVCGRVNRSLRYLVDYMRYVTPTRPYSYLGKLHRGMNEGYFSTSVFDRRASNNIEDLIWFQEWYKEHERKLQWERENNGRKTKNVYVPKAKLEQFRKEIDDAARSKVHTQEYRVIFSNMRHNWSEFYMSYASSYMSMYRLAGIMSPDATYDLSDVTGLSKRSSSLGILACMVLGAAVECIICKAKAVAYNWHKIILKGTKHGTDPVMDKYADLLLDTAYEDIEDLVTVDSKMGYKDSSSKMKEAAEKAMKEVVSFMPKISMKKDTVEAIFYEAYKKSEKMVKRSVVEMIKRDHAMLVQPAKLSDHPSGISSADNDEEETKGEDVPALDLSSLIASITASIDPTSTVKTPAITEDWIKEAYGAFADVSFDVQDSDPQLHRQLVWIEDNIREQAINHKALKSKIVALTRVCSAAAYAGADCAAECFDRAAREDIDLVYRAFGGASGSGELME